MAATNVQMRRFVRRVLKAEEHTYYSRWDLARQFTIPVQILNNIQPQGGDNSILSLPAEILDTILRALKESCDRIIFALSGKTFASIYTNSTVSEKSQLKVLKNRPSWGLGPLETETNPLVCRLSTILSHNLRFCPRCRLFRTSERSFWNRWREYIKATLRENPTTTFGTNKKEINLGSLKWNASWASIVAGVRYDINVDQKISALNGIIGYWCGLSRFNWPPYLELYSADPHAGYWMDCPAHVFDKSDVVPDAKKF